MQGPDWIRAWVIVDQSVRRSVFIYIPKQQGSGPKAQDKLWSPTK